MTVSSDVNRISYAGNGSTTVFPVNYYFLENSHLQVILITSAGVETIQTLTTNYTVTGAGNEAGGSVTMLVAPPVNVTIVIQRSVPATQETDYLANDPFPAESHERALDKLTMLAQQNEREIDRALKIPLASVATTSTELPIPVGNKLLAWNSNATAITNFDPADIISVVGQQTSYGDVFTGNGSTVNFTLSRSPGSVFNLDVSVNGVTQVPNVDYTLGGTTLTFTSAPPAVASKILARYSEVYEEVDADAQNVRYLPAGVGAQLTNVQAKLRQTVSVQDFGAVGDGVADDTAAIQAAIAAIPANGGDLFFPPGQYLFSSKITIAKKVRLIGSGNPSETLANTGSTVLIKAASLLDDGIVLAVAGASIENLEIEGQTGNTGDGIVIAAGRVVLTDVAVYNMGRDGVRIGTDAGINANIWQIRNLKSKSNGRHGLHISDKVFPTPPDANGGNLSGADLQSNASDGLHLGNAQLNTFTAVVCQSNGANGINVTAAGIGNTFVGGESEANTLDEILCDASSVGNTFLGIMVPGTVVNNDAQNIFVGGYGHQIGNGIFLGNRGSLNTKTLDWYEEGTVIPQITFATPGDLAITYATQYGRFTRIGNLVSVSINVLTSAFTYTTAAGELRITGMPYTTLNVGGAISASGVLYSGVTDALRPVLSAFVSPNTNYVVFRLSGSGVGTANPAQINLPSGSTVALAFTLNYQVPT